VTIQAHVDFGAVAIDTEGKIRARLRFTTKFEPSAADACA
jgi:hypothetical protein